MITRIRKDGYTLEEIDDNLLKEGDNPGIKDRV